MNYQQIFLAQILKTYVTSNWVSLLVHNVKKLESEKHILGQRVAKLEADR